MQESDGKKCEKKESSGPPLQTASIGVRALIEEKIIQKRITTSLGAHTQTSLTYSSKCTLWYIAYTDNLILVQ